MNKKFLLLLLAVMVALISVSATWAVAQGDASNNTTISVKAEKIMSLSEAVNMIQVQPVYKNYDQTTLDWLKGLDSSCVVLKNGDNIIVMNSTDADKLNTTGKTGVSFSNNITCTILENRSLGNGLPDILHVENVEVISMDSHNFDFSK